MINKYKCWTSNLIKVDRDAITENYIYVIIFLLEVYLCESFFQSTLANDYVYYVNILVIPLLLLLMLEAFQTKYIRYTLLYTGILILGSAMIFRDQMGVDDYIYRHHFNEVENLSLFSYFSTSEIEPGYLFLNWIVFYLVGGDYNIGQVVLSSVTFLLWGKSFYSLSKSGSLLSLMFILLWSHYYFFVLSAGIVRIFMAIPIVLYAIPCIWEGNIRRYLVLIILASTIHISSLIMLLFIPFFLKHNYYFEHWGKFLFVISIGLLVVFLTVARFLVPLLGSRYSGYAEVNAFTIALGSFDTLPILLIALYFFKYFKQDYDVNKKRYIVGLVLLALSIIFSILSTMVALGRTIFYANLGIIILYSCIFSIKSRSALDFSLKIILIAYPIVYVMHTAFLNPSSAINLFPYSSILKYFL